MGSIGAVLERLSDYQYDAASTSIYQLYTAAVVYDEIRKQHKLHSKRRTRF